MLLTQASVTSLLLLQVKNPYRRKRPKEIPTRFAFAAENNGPNGKGPTRASDHVFTRGRHSDARFQETEKQRETYKAHRLAKLVNDSVVKAARPLLEEIAVMGERGMFYP